MQAAPASAGATHARLAGMKPAFDEYVDELSRTERLPLRELAHYQQQLLAELVWHACDHLPFYRDRLICLLTTDERIDLSRWSDVPFLTREDVIRHGPDMRVRNLSPEYGEIAEPNRTVKASGKALHCLRSE